VGSNPTSGTYLLPRPVLQLPERAGLSSENVVATLAEQFQRKNPIVWMDLEMTGLDPERDHIIEIATLITDADLHVLAEGPELVIHQPDGVLEAMDDWNRHHHRESGLTERVRASKITLAQAERATLEFLKEWTDERTAPLAGNSIHQDRRFLARYMRGVDGWLHYRMIDVSTVKELAKRWFPTAHDRMNKKRSSHRAMDDIRASIDELRYYRRTIFHSY
jgi:oligoribonuclease